MLVIGVLAPMLAPYSYSNQSLLQRLQPPGAAHWLGTDGFGRDVLSRVMWGSRVSLEIGFAATALSLVVGTVVGSVAGYFGRGVDTAVMRAADAFLSVPALFLILIVVALFGASLRNTALVIALVTWAPVARVVRAECLSLRTREFVHAAHALGAGHVRILGRHVLVNALPVVIGRPASCSARPSSSSPGSATSGWALSLRCRAGATWWSRADSSWPPPGGSRRSPAWPSS